MINISLPDGAVRQYESGVSALDVAKSISEGLARKVLAAIVNGQVWDASRPIYHDATLKLLTWKIETVNLLSGILLPSDGRSGRIIISGSEILVGPALDNGFYYDMDLVTGNWWKMIWYCWKRR